MDVHVQISSSRVNGEKLYQDNYNALIYFTDFTSVHISNNLTTDNVASTLNIVVYICLTMITVTMVMYPLRIIHV